MSSCQSCPYPTKSCPSEGPEDADLLIIGESPGKSEILNQKPFSGPSGDLLNQSLSQADIDRSEAFITNTIGCRIPNNESPSQEAVVACESRRKNEIEEVDPDVILSLGDTASKAVLDTEKGINELRGKAYQKDGRWVVPTLHPAQCLRVEETFRDFWFDIKKCRDILDDDHEFPILDTNYNVVNNVFELKKALDELKQFDYLGADIEATGLDWIEDDLVTLSFGQNGWAVVIEWRDIVHKDKARDILSWFFRQDVNLIWHNAQYDRKVMECREELSVPMDYDTMIMHHLGVDERSGKDIRSLGKLSKEWLNAEDWESEFKEKYFEPDDKDITDAPREELYKYASKDVDATYRLFDIFWNEEMDEQLRDTYHNLVQPSQETLVQTEQNGMYVDKDHLKDLEDKYTKEIGQLETKLKEKALELGFDIEEYLEEGWAKTEPGEWPNFESDPQCHYMYHSVMDFPRFKGDHTASADAREYYRDEVIGDKADPRKEFIDTHDQYKAVNKLYNTYIKGMWKHIKGDRIHPDFLMFGTDSGRLSSRSPNSQNIGNKEEIKNIITSPEDRKIMEIDFSQNELRYLAVDSGDPNMKEIYAKGQDLHDKATERIYGEDWSHWQRKITKNGQFGLIYGAGARKLKETTGMPINEAKEWMEDWANNFPVAWETLKEREKAYKQDGPYRTIDTLTGRRIRLGLITDNNLNDVQNRCKNLPIQGGASDLTLLAANEVRRFLDGLEAMITNLVHDSIMIEYEPSLEEMLVAQVPPIMENTAEEALDSDIPWVADVDLSQRESAGWGELKEINRERWLAKHGE